MKPHLGARLKRRPAQSFALPPVLFSNAGLAPPASPAQGLLAERCSPQHVRSQSAAFHNELSLSPCTHVQPASQRGAPLAVGVARVAGDTSLRPAFCSCRPGPHPPPWAAWPCLVQGVLSQLGTQPPAPPLTTSFIARPSPQCLIPAATLFGALLLSASRRSD